MELMMFVIALATCSMGGVWMTIKMAEQRP